MGRRFRKLHAPADLGIETARHIVELVIRGELHINALSQAQGNFAKKAVYRLVFGVRSIHIRERIGTELIFL